MAKKCIVTLALLLAFMVSGCGTMEGMGKDLSKLGGKIEKEAKK